MWKVVALGIANAGKSAVLSALAKERGLFPDGEVPHVTRKIQKHAVGSLLLVDTPAWDDEVADADWAMKVAAAADTVLWCHSLRISELHAVELAALRRCHAGSRAIGKTCFVLTHADNVASEKIVRAVSARIARQLREVFGLQFQDAGEPPPKQKVGECRLPKFNVVALGTYWRALQLGKEQREKSWIKRLIYWRTYLAAEKQRRITLHRLGIPRLRSFLEALGQIKVIRKGPL